MAPAGSEGLGEGGGAIWEVVGGADRGGIVVRKAQELGSTVESLRLSTGALVLELELVGERLCYQLLEGSGPISGWVSTKLKEKQLVVRTGQYLAPGGGVAPSTADGQAVAGEAGGFQPPPRSRGASAGAAPAPEPPLQQQPSGQQQLWEQQPAQARRPEPHGLQWIPGDGSGGGKFAKMADAELEEVCSERGLELRRLESRGHAAALLERLDRLDRMRVPELKNEVKKRGMATTVGSKQQDLVTCLRDAFLWEHLRIAELQQVCRDKELPVLGDETRQDLLQMLAYSSWEARGVPVWRLPSDTVAHGILDQLDKLDLKDVEELAAQCEKRGLPLEQEWPAKEVLIGRLRTCIVWELLPVPELRRECEDLGVPPEELEEMLGKADEPQQQNAAQWRPRPFGGSSPESMQKEVLLRRLLEQMWLAWEDGLRIAQYYEIFELPDTASIDDLKKSYKKLALRHHPDKNKEAGQDEQRTREFQLISEAYESLLAYIGAVQGEAAGEDGETEEGDQPQTAIFMGRHGERLDDAELAKGRLWVRAAERPWDPPLSERGRLQAMALGKAVGKHTERLGLPAITRVFTSPFLRCVETAVEVSRQLSVSHICIEPSLCESFCESFYRAWCVPGATGDWGGPETCRCGVAVPPERLRREARGPASELLHPVWLKHAKGSAGRINSDYEPFLPLSELRFTWDDFEIQEQYGTRLRAFFDFVAGAFPGEGAVFISHAGPLKVLFAGLRPDLPSQMPGYCALYALHRPQGRLGADGGPAEWAAPLVADAEHMQRWARQAPGASSRNGAVRSGPGGNGPRTRGRGVPPPGIHVP